MVIEKDTTYAYAIKHLQNPSFECIRNVAVNFRKGLSDEEQTELYDMLNRGVDLISNEPQMMMYLHSFGLMHQAKLKYAFKHLPQEFFQQDTIEIIDYGCGQAIGEMVYADYLRSHNISQNVTRITLIEPSETCLKRAALHAKLFFPDAEIRTICKTFDDLIDEDIETDENSVKLHILSNVLDIESFDLERLANLIDNNTKGYNQFVCVGPYFNYSDKDERIANFAEYLGGKISYSKCFDKNEFIQNKSWTCNVCIFEKGKVSKPETYTDEQGVVYGNYGKLLIRATPDLYEYYYGENNSANINVVVLDLLNNDSFSLLSIDIPDSVTEIGEMAFGDCYYLQNITIPDSVQIIGNEAFGGCHSLQSITIPNSVMQIGEGAFAYCHSLQSIKVDIKNEKYCADDNVLFNKSKNIIIRCSTKYEEYSIPDSVTIIGNGAFCGCRSLQNIHIPDSVTEIGDCAFYGCLSLQSITIPAAVTEIGDWAFCDCPNLHNIKVNINNRNYCSVDDVLFNKNKTVLIRCSTKYKEYSIPDSVTKIEYGAFSNCRSLQCINIPDSVTIIEKCAFLGCDSLRCINIPDSVTKIGWRAFEGCSNLRSIKIPDSVTEIGESAFRGCSSLQNIKVSDNVSKNVLKSILDEVDNDKLSWTCNVCVFEKNNIPIPETYTDAQGVVYGNYGKLLKKAPDELIEYSIPDSVTEIEGWAFSDCSNLQSIEVDINNKYYCADNDVLFNKNKTILIRCSTKYKEYTIPDSVTEIGEDAFSGCGSLQSINIPDSVTEIGESAFNGCSNLQNIIITDSVTEIGWYAFRNCSSLQSIIIPDSVTEIGGNVFAGCENLTTVKLTKNITKLESYSVDECSSIPLDEDNGFFYNCHCLQNIIIPDSVTEIGDWAFSGCSNLQSINLPDSITYIGWNVFKGCSSLRNITIPNSVTKIGGYTFRNCSSLQSINIPDSVTEIESYVFEGCSSLRSIKVSDNVNTDVLQQILHEIDSDIERLNKLKEQLPTLEPEDEDDGLPF